MLFGEEDQVVFEDIDLDGLRSRIQPFISNISNTMIPGTALKCSPWPIVRCISRGLESWILQLGLILLDILGEYFLHWRLWPSFLTSIIGHGDVNTTYVEKARRSLCDADIIIVVHDMDWVASNQSVEKALKWAHKRRGIDGVIMVCTKSDAVCESASMGSTYANGPQNLDNDFDPNSSDKEKDQLGNINAQLRHIDECLEEPSQQKSQIRASADAATFIHVDREISRKE